MPKKTQAGNLQKSGRYTFSVDGKQYDVKARKGETGVQLAVRAELKKREIEGGIVRVDKNIAVKKWAEEWLETYKRPTIDSSTYSDYESRFKNQINPIIGTLRLCDVKPLHCQKVLNNMQGFSRDRINKVAYTMQSLFEQAIDDGLIATNPAKRLKRPVSEDGTHRAITDAERKVILQVAETHPYGLWVKLMLYCGLRPAETAALVWSNIDLKNNRLHITQALKKNGSIGMPKSKAGVRAVPIPNTLRDELARHFGSPFFYVFCNRNNSCLIHRNMQTMWNSFKREMNISMGCKVYRNEVLPPYWVADDLSPYCLRHTYCTDLQSAGVPINVAKELWPGFQQNQKPSNS